MAARGQGITVTYVAWDTANNAGKTGDVANHTLRWVKDGTASAPSNSPAEVDATNAPGVYKLALTGTEMTMDCGTLSGKSSTANVVIIPLTVTTELLPVALVGGRVDASMGAVNDAAGVRSAVGLSAANLEALLAAIAGYIDTEVAAILAAVDTEVAAIKAKTDNLPASPAAVGSAMTLASGAIDSAAVAAAAANKIADHILRRALASALASSDGDTKTFRSLAGAIAKLVNRIVSSGGTLTIYEPDDTTSLGTQALTTDAAAEPIVEANTV